MNAFFVTIPHSGESIAPETPWLKGLPETTLMRDVDRYIDYLYAPAIKELGLDSIETEWHRYVVDLNRFPEDIDESSVHGAKLPSGTHPKGLHWSVTTHNEPLIEQPMSWETHELLLEKYYQPFHSAVSDHFESKLSAGAPAVFQLDAHSMPSKGTQFHLDPGETRAEIVLGDVHATSCAESYRALVEKAYKDAGFQVVMNWPYKGGRITERYGVPAEKRHTIQVEMNRNLYMNEETKQLETDKAEAVREQLKVALKIIIDNVPGLSV